MFVLLDAMLIKEDGMEDRLLVAKALLECYPFIEDMERALTHSSEELARNGFYAIFPKEQMQIYEQIIRNGMRRSILAKMKGWIDAAFAAGDSPSLSILRERYLYHTSMFDIMNRYGVCVRTCYRYIRKGLAELASLLDRKGADKRTIIIECGNESLFSMMLGKVIEEDDQESLSDGSNRMQERRRGQRINSRRIHLHHGNNGGHGRCYM